MLSRLPVAAQMHLTKVVWCVTLVLLPAALWSAYTLPD